MSGETKETGATDKVGALLAAAGAAMVVGFFLPWAGFGGFTISGFDLVRESGWANRALGLVPLLGAALAYCGTRDGKSARSLGVLTGVLVIGWTLFETSSSFVESLRWGGWIAVAAAAGLMGSGAAKQRGLVLVASGAAALAFFLPWAGDASGFDIARAATSFDATSLVFTPVWLVIGGAALGALSAAREASTGRIAALGGALVLVGVMWPYIGLIVLTFSIGAWLVLGGAAAALAFGLATKRA